MPATQQPITKAPPPLVGRRASRLLGSIAPGAPPIFIPALVLERMLAHAEPPAEATHPKFTPTCLGGWFLGHFYIEATGKTPQPYVEVKQFLPAASRGSTDIKTNLTRKRWQQFSHNLADQFPQRSLVGWQVIAAHSSGTLAWLEAHLHRFFFQQPGQFILVVDPVDRELGLYTQVGERLVNSGFLVIPKAARAS